MFDLLIPLNRIQQLYDIKQQTQMAELLGIALNTYRDNLTKAKNDLKDKKLKVKKKEYQNALYGKFVDLATKDNINLNWLFYGELPVYKNKPEIKVHIEDDSQVLTKDFIPFYETLDSYSNNEKKNILLPSSFSKGKNLIAIKISDNLMEPNILRNSIAIIDTSKKTIKDYFVYLCKYNKEFLIKRVQLQDDNIILKSDNITSKITIAKNDEVVIFGRVLNTITTTRVK